MRRLIGILAAGLLGACGSDAPEDEAARSMEVAAAAAPAEERVATTLGGADASLPADAIEGGRRDPGWRQFVRLDTTAAGADATAPSSEAWEDISAETVNTARMHVPLDGDAEGPSVLRTQILLDRALFSPGIIDGKWGKNTEKAVYWFQEHAGLPANGTVDQRTFERLAEVAGTPGELVRRHTLTQEDVSGPFVQIPEDIYEQAELECMCYESQTEKLAERFHVSPELLAQLNPGVDLDAVQAGDALQVPAVRGDAPPTRGQVARLVISDGGHYLHALDAAGKVLYHFPTTLGSEYAPSPSGEWSVTAIAEDPTWHYQPDLLTGEPDHKEDAIIPPGPNNPVGVVWMQLSKEHYGIHGTSAPETIGYATSHGCVRLTNWDASFLSGQVSPGTPVEFRDVGGRGSATADGG